MSNSSQLTVKNAKFKKEKRITFLFAGVAMTFLSLNSPFKDYEI